MSDLKFIINYNPALPDIHNIIQNIYQYCTLMKIQKKIFPSKSIKTLYRKEKNPNEILSLSLFPAKSKNSESCITSCKKCDICKNYLISDNKFESKVTGGFYNVRVNLSCNSNYVIYLISCKKCEDQYIISTIKWEILAMPAIYKHTWHEKCFRFIC